MSDIVTGHDTLTVNEDLTTALRVPVGNLRKTCDPLKLKFENSDELPETSPYLGQQRAIDAIRFGTDVRRDGYNLFILGPHGSDRHGLANRLAMEQAASREPPSDWCYVNNFSDPECPRTLRLPAGEGTRFRDDMKDLIGDLRLAIPAAFESDDYRNRLK